MVQKLSDIKMIVEDYVLTLEKKGIHVEKAILFGSYAKGTAHDGSDIDLAIISADLNKFPFPERLSFLSKATLHINAPLEVLGYTPEEIRAKEGQSILWDEVNTSGKVIFEAA